MWTWLQNNENKLDGKEIKPKCAKYDAEAKTDRQMIETRIQFIRHINVLNIMEGKLNGKKGRRWPRDAILGNVKKKMCNKL